MKNILCYTLLGGILAFAACKTSKRVVHPHQLPEPTVPPAPQVFACGFKAAVFEGKLPCFGNDCGEHGAPMTTIQFYENKTVVKVQRSSTTQMTVAGTWTIDDQCLITVSNPNGIKTEYYRYQSNSVRKLSDAKTVYNGAFKDQYILHYKN
ncbi:hypothetical protein [Taibaiella sp. KBW10]|uniref:copper resistance protein NlpE N-terminal domain-containing protein n=1 Tax=Taibaiella sp. KBW10 TaxID=2153357 RepID=UPI000F5B36C7|nr:hypothetical protein [Taibaiella sp. KBW10]